MNDLVTGYLIVAATSVLACCLGAFLVRWTQGIVRTLAIAILLVLVLAFASKIQGHLILAQWLPFSNVILVGNLTMVGAACFAGVVLAWPSLPVWRRLLFATCMWMVGMVALLHQMPRDPPPAGNEWIDGVCMQSNRASCSACAAATLLSEHGIPADEAEMMELCLTGAGGTPTLGLYRGLKLKTAGTPYDVEVFRTDIESLLDSSRLPAILLVMLELDADADPRYQRDWGWIPGLGHAVVYYGRAGNDRILVGDPSVGREKWTIDDLRVLWQGEGLRLRRR
ncbi:MAG: cysteine peptidase family C39 domain-containing protein [Thermoguttaceae bacterium]